VRQFSFVFDPKSNGDETWEVERTALRDAIALLSLKEVAFQLDVNRSAISDAIDERKTENSNGNVTEKRWAARWTHVIRAMLMKRGDKASLDIVERLVDAHTIGTQFIVDDPDYSDEEVEAAQRVVDSAKRRRARIAEKRAR